MKNNSTPRRIPVVNVRGAYLRRTDLSGASLRNAILSRADFSDAVFRDADFFGALLDGTILRGADLTGARNLTIEQLSEAFLDHATILPSYIDRHKLTLSEGHTQEATNA